ncbi:DAK2 domain-containing protein [Cellulomonas sp. DKR-3]|uniref:DAK2 domain-containing protein n=1 Tax=Cellulomonas fulva TaxID=2835530 RepID=A0ABS5TZT2_9CELL|nr:DAK2 domain-containing protein [Cellulomonas fulva]MBT0994668.1 DAK2 domain-containing protein [Cellulomonas fulva]
MTDRGELRAAQVAAWARSASTALADARGGIDAVNVFPVADADTGTNAWLTVQGGALAVEQLGGGSDGADARELLATFARGAMVAARGNSGVILSQWLAGFARRAVGPAGTPEPAAGLVAAARAARSALGDPQEGTVLTLADEVADAATLAADAGASPAAVVTQAAAAGHQALARISAQHPVLRLAHVPDAGACALLVVVDALAASLAGTPVRAPSSWLPRREVAAGDERSADRTPGGAAGDEVPCGAGSHGPAPAAGGAYEVMLVVHGTPPGPEVGDALRSALGRIGDSVAVVGADGWWHAHVHTDEPARAVEACAVGRREQVVVRRLDIVDVLGSGAPVPGWGLVVVTASPGLAAWYATAGAVVVVRCGEEPVTAAHVRRAVEDTGAADVLLVPGGAVAGVELEELLDDPGLEVLGADDEARALVATLAFATGEAAGVHAAALATARVRVAALPVPEVARLRATVEALVAGSEPAESLTVVVPEVEDDERAAVDARAHEVARALGLEATVVVGAAGPVMLVAVD